MNIDAEYADLEVVNCRFNNELQRQIDGVLQPGHVYQLGRPGRVLRTAGVRDLPMELSARRLAYKASANYHHPFDIACLKNLPLAINHPVAVFDNITGDVSKIILTELKDAKGNNFVVAVRVHVYAGSREILVEVNETKTIYPKDRVLGIIEWINSKRNALIWVDKEKALNFISTQPSNSAAGGNSIQGVDPKLISLAIQKIQHFQNPA
ncbi:MAG: hypothetical protein FWB85_09160 [Chitinispirillia bacterium]|nr:hypothetical protein [Chitinispirillia bacterium]